MLRIYKNDGINFQELTVDNTTRNVWVNLVNPTADELQLVAEKTNSPIDFLKAALDEEERPRIEVEDESALILINIPVMLSESSYDTLPLGIILSKDSIVTVCLENNPVILEFNEYNRRTFNTAKRTRFLFQMLYKSATYYLRYIRQISRLSEQIEIDLRKTMKNKELFQLMDLQQGLTYFTSSLRSNGIVMDRLLRIRSNNQCQHLIQIYEEDEDLLEDVIIENNQAVQMVEMYSRILSGMADTSASIISNNLNMVMKFLTSMTIILAIPTMIASFWGMNVHVPFKDERLGFLIVAGIIIVITGATTYVLMRKKIL
ncbi:magnesium transporter CorA family protein [Dehalobacter sp. DCM]|uniref:magnesium transporter CorA family protein n=1 Tax=Dehalobacter sp. DCM TaxID=2907827 RepID=UPI00308126F2|nr:magnesium transporter CorA family protein [Dehalobacter sp. DCM]